jgi:flagellar biosynthesis protein FlhF
VERIEVKEYAEAYLQELLTRMVKVSGPLLGRDAKRKVAVLIGPTGVGKTTTIAKLAARYALGEKARVALIAMDTFRVAAVEQLKDYGKLLGIPVDVAGSIGDVKEILNKRKDADLILMDTAGRSQRDHIHMAELADLFRQGLALETFLVLSATTKEDDLKDILKKYKWVPLDSLIFTKLDETTTYGNIFNTLVGTGKSLSYLATGQKVPEDIELASPGRVTDLIFKKMRT